MIPHYVKVQLSLAVFTALAAALLLIDQLTPAYDLIAYVMIIFTAVFFLSRLLQTLWHKPKDHIFLSFDSVSIYIASYFSFYVLARISLLILNGLEPLSPSSSKYTASCLF